MKFAVISYRKTYVCARSTRRRNNNRDFDVSVRHNRSVQCEGKLRIHITYTHVLAANTMCSTSVTNHVSMLGTHNI